MPFGCSGSAPRIELRSNGQRVFLAPAQVTLPPGSYQLSMSVGVRVASLPPGLDPGGRPPSNVRVGDATCS